MKVIKKRKIHWFDGLDKRVKVLNIFRKFPLFFFAIFSGNLGTILISICFSYIFNPLFARLFDWCHHSFLVLILFCSRISGVKVYWVKVKAWLCWYPWFWDIFFGIISLLWLQNIMSYGKEKRGIVNNKTEEQTKRKQKHD